MEIVAAGTVSDFTEDVQSAMKLQIAATLQVAPSAVRLEVVPASVRLIVLIDYPSAQAVDAARCGLAQGQLASISAASSFLSTAQLLVTAEAVAMLTDSPSIRQSPPCPPASDGDKRPPTWLVVGLAVLAVLLFLIAVGIATKVTVDCHVEACGWHCVRMRGLVGREDTSLSQTASRRPGCALSNDAYARSACSRQAAYTPDDIEHVTSSTSTSRRDAAQPQLSLCGPRQSAIGCDDPAIRVAVASPQQRRCRAGSRSDGSSCATPPFYHAGSNVPSPQAVCSPGLTPPSPIGILAAQPAPPRSYHHAPTTLSREVQAAMDEAAMDDAAMDDVGMEEAMRQPEGLHEVRRADRAVATAAASAVASATPCYHSSGHEAAKSNSVAATATPYRPPPVGIPDTPPTSEQLPRELFPTLTWPTAGTSSSIADRGDHGFRDIPVGRGIDHEAGIRRAPTAATTPSLEHRSLEGPSCSSRHSSPGIVFRI